MKPCRLLFLPMMLLALSGFMTEEISAERRAQDKLPQSQDEMWKTFGACKVHYDNKKYTYSITYTPEVKALAGKKITVSGFMLPLESKEQFTHFLLSKRTPTCPFCPPGEPNEIVEVFSKKPVKWDDGMVIVTGPLSFTTNPDLGLFFQIKDADMMSALPPETKKSKASSL